MEFEESRSTNVQSEHLCSEDVNRREVRSLMLYDRHGTLEEASICSPAYLRAYFLASSEFSFVDKSKVVRFKNMLLNGNNLFKRKCMPVPGILKE